MTAAMSLHGRDSLAMYELLGLIHVKILMFVIQESIMCTITVCLISMAQLSC